MAWLVGRWVAIVGVSGGWGGEEVVVGGMAWPGDANPRRPPVGSLELVRGRRGLLRGYSGLSPVCAAVGALKKGGWSWEGVVACLVGWWVAIVGVPVGWGGEEVAVKGVGLAGRWEAPRRPPVGSPELVRERRGRSGAVRTVCPLHSLQWRLLRREDGLGEG
mgnify:CR=1 FL=1